MIDISIIIILIIGFYFGYKKGLIQQLVGIITIVLAYFFARNISVLLQKILVENNILSQNTSIVYSYILCVLLIFIGVKLISYIIEFLFKISFINIANRFIGGVFGTIKYFIYILIFIFLFERINNIIDFIDLKNINSRIYPIFKTTESLLTNLLS